MDIYISRINVYKYKVATYLKACISAWRIKLQISVLLISKVNVILATDSPISFLQTPGRKNILLRLLCALFIRLHGGYSAATAGQLSRLCFSVETGQAIKDQAVLAGEQRILFKNTEGFFEEGLLLLWFDLTKLYSAWCYLHWRT